jgi:hypothetical protein
VSYARLPEIVLHLLGQPGFGGGIESDGKAQRHFRANADSPIEELRKALAANAKRSGRGGHGEPQWLDAQFSNYFPRVGRVVHLQHYRVLSVIIHVIDIDYVFALETKDDSPVPADIDGKKSMKIAFQWMKPQTRKVHVLRRFGAGQSGKNQAEALRVIGPNAALTSGHKEFLQSSVPE